MTTAPCNAKTTEFVSLPSTNFTAIRLSNLSLSPPFQASQIGTLTTKNAMAVKLVFEKSEPIFLKLN